ncbi:hypothetical protein KEJ26_04020 [Candidatus Bathyarchaeota archaeon]|nr:hypothetical protein [Candidatus Bathyarchaeota archaeon]
MAILTGEEVEKEMVMQVSKLMLVSARTSPKSWGVDDVLTAVLIGAEKESLAAEMDRIADERGIDGFNRDADNVRNSETVVLIGVRGTKSVGDSDCGACGFKTCVNFNRVERTEGKDFLGPTCVFKAIDLGIALGSAVKTASLHNVDNRTMYRVGVAARRLKFLPEATIVIGIPVSAKGKSIYFDRKWKAPTK